MKSQLTILAFLHIFTRQQTHGQSCVAAGYSNCCTVSCFVGVCYCDRACHINNDCCADIHLICPESTPTTEITNETTIIPGNLSPTTHYSDAFSSLSTYIEAKATFVIDLRPRVSGSTDYTIYTISKRIVPSATRADQQLITTQHKAITRSRSVDLKTFVNIIPLSTSVMHMYTSRIPEYPAVTEQGTIVDTQDPSLSTTQNSSQAVTLREAVAWALLSLMTLMFIGILSVNVTILCIKKHRQRRDSNVTVTAEAPVYEMDGNPCYESSKIDTTYGANIYEPIESGRVQYL